MIFYYLFYNSKANTCARILLLAMQLLKHLKDALTEMRFKADAIVPYCNMRILLLGRKLFGIHDMVFYDPATYHYM